MVGGKVISRTSLTCAVKEPATLGENEAGVRVIDTGTLFAGARTVCIRHGAELYTLRITRADKLILTK